MNKLSRDTLGNRGFDDVEMVYIKANRRKKYDRSKIDAATVVGR